MTIVTPDEFGRAVKVTVGKGMTNKETRALAEYVQSFFGYETEVIDNKLEPDDRDVFYMLEEAGLLYTRQEEVFIKKGKLWRIHYWGLKKDRIKELARNGHSKEDDPIGFYEEIPEDVWANHAYANPQKPSELISLTTMPDHS